MKDSWQSSGWLLIAGVILLVDQLSKAWVRSSITVGGRMKIFPILSFTHSLNSGAGFGILQNWNVALIFIAFVALIVLSWYAPGFDLHARMWSGALIGGIIGNLIDRLALGGVTDFILFSLGGASFPSFNVADTAITLSILVLVLGELKKK